MANWILEPGHTAAEFSVRHMMVTNVRGHFKNVHGVIEFDPQDPRNGSVEVTIDAGKIWTGDADRDGHLRGDDFLATEAHSEIFVATTRINRHDFGITWDARMENDGLVGNSVEITVDAEAILE